MLSINVIVSSNLPYSIQLMCILGLDYYELYAMEEREVYLFHDFIYRVCSGVICHIKLENKE